jgi:predicted nucleic acid-binding protein
VTVFVDTSALYALADEDDERHQPARATFGGLGSDREWLITHSYVLVETLALVDARLGHPAARQMADGIFPVIEVMWVDRQLHTSALRAFLASSRRASFVDWVSFTLLRERGLTRVFAYDRDFTAQGFQLVT